MLKRKTVCGVVQFIKYRVTGKALKRKRQGEGLLYPVTEPKTKDLLVYTIRGKHCVCEIFSRLRSMIKILLKPCDLAQHAKRQCQHSRPGFSNVQHAGHLWCTNHTHGALN